MAVIVRGDEIYHNVVRFAGVYGASGLWCRRFACFCACVFIVLGGPEMS